jgi:hypothetical protein
MKRLPDRLRITPSQLKSVLLDPVWLTLGTIAVVISLFAAGTPVLDRIELNWLDLRFRTRGPIAPKPTVVLAAIDEKSVEAEGRWPWPRSRIAALIDALSRGARVIAFDVTFSEPDENSRLKLVDQLARKVDSLHVQIPQLADFIRESRIDADNDRTLVRALERSKAAIVLGYFFHMSAAGYKLNEAGMGANSGNRRFQISPRLLRLKAPRRCPHEGLPPQGNLEIFTAAATRQATSPVTTIRRCRPLDAIGDPRRRRPASTAVATKRLALPGQAPASVRVRQRRRGGSGRRSLCPDRRGRRAADQLPWAAEDLPPLLH